MLFESIQWSSVGSSGHSVMLTVLVSQLGKGEWKGVELDVDVSLRISFGCCYIQFNLPVASSSELVAKHPSAFDMLLASVARHDKLPGKPGLFLPKFFNSDQSTPIFRQLSGNKIFLVWPNVY